MLDLVGFELEAGIPRNDKYDLLCKSRLFHEIESFSDKFVQGVRNHLAKIHWTWPIDPFHTWSRQWEYLFVVFHLAKWRAAAKERNTDSAIRLMDFGSGFSFFPWLLSKNGWDVACVDIDTQLLELFRLAGEPNNVDLDIIEGVSLSYPDDSFNAVISISVLEHLELREQVLKELYRVLRPGGILIITFDVSLDNVSDIPVPQAKKLLKTLEKMFNAGKVLSNVIEELDTLKERPELFLTTDWARQAAPELLPWHLSTRSILRSLTRLQFPRCPFYSLAFCCLTMMKVN